MFKRFRSAITGKFVTRKEAEEFPATTVGQLIAPDHYLISRKSLLCAYSTLGWFITGLPSSTDEAIRNDYKAARAEIRQALYGE